MVGQQHAAQPEATICALCCVSCLSLHGLPWGFSHETRKGAQGSQFMGERRNDGSQAAIPCLAGERKWSQPDPTTAQPWSSLEPATTQPWSSLEPSGATRPDQERQQGRLYPLQSVGRQEHLTQHYMHIFSSKPAAFCMLCKAPPKWFP